MAVLRGANAPMLQRMVVEELAKEKLVLDSGGGRKVVSSETRMGSCNNSVYLIRIFNIYNKSTS